MTKLCTEAWLLRGISSIPGELRLRKDVLTFVPQTVGSAWPWQLRKLERVIGAPGFAKALEDGGEPLLFEWPTAEVTAWCPWYYFGGGIKLRRGAITLRFSLGRPANMDANFGSSGSPLALEQAADNLSEVGAMRRRGKLWLAALGKAGQRSRGAA